jgi:ribosomal protein S18 acetylase RimI-like enzyme
MIKYRRPKLAELKDIARMCALTFAEYPIFYEIRSAFNNLESFIDFLSNFQYVFLKTHYKKSECFVGEENGKIKSYAVIARPHSSSISILDYVWSGGLKLLKKVSLPRLMRFLNLQEEGYRPCNGIKKHSWFLEFIAVDKSCKGQQLGTKMLQECVIPFIMEQSYGTKPETFVTFTNTENNSKFYLKNGFTEFDYTTIKRNGTTIGNWSFRMIINPS